MDHQNVPCWLTGSVGSLPGKVKLPLLDRYAHAHRHARCTLTRQSSADGALTPAAHTRMKVRLPAGFYQQFHHRQTHSVRRRQISGEELSVRVDSLSLTQLPKHSEVPSSACTPLCRRRALTVLTNLFWFYYEKKQPANRHKNDRFSLKKKRRKMWRKDSWTKFLNAALHIFKLAPPVSRWSGNAPRLNFTSKR